MKKEEILAKSRKEKKDEREKANERNEHYYSLVAADALIFVLTFVDIELSTGKSVLGELIIPMFCTEMFGIMLYRFLHNGKKITNLLGTLIFLALTIYFTWAFIQNVY